VINWVIYNSALTLSIPSLGLELYSWTSILPNLLISAALGQSLSIFYEWSYEGLSFSRRFVNSLTLLTLTSCVLMLAISFHLTLGLGLLGSMAMIRFRVNTRDLWEMSFVFAALVSGLCCGINLILIASMFTLLFCITAYCLAKGQVGAQFRYDGVLRFWLPYQALDQDQQASKRSSHDSQIALEGILSRYGSNYQLISMREGSQGEGAEVTYHITLKGRRRTEQKAHSRAALFNDLKTLLNVEELTLLSQDHHLEL
jgi:hypothetical protein